MLAAAAAALAVAGGPSPERAHIDLTLVGDERLRELSREYLDADHYTDVMSFSQVESGSAGGGDEPAVHGGPKRQLLGDVVVSLDRARDQAARAGHGVPAELALLVAHGVLHLLGFNDDTAAGKAAMRDLERRAMSLAGVQVG
jgi:probable rRNA maturation factor